MSFPATTETLDICSLGSVAIWERSVGGSFDLHRISLALDVSMVGFLISAFFYNMTYRHWFYTLLVVAIVFSKTIKSETQPISLGSVNRA